MPDIKDFLGKFKKILNEDINEKEIIVQIFKDILDVDIKKEDMSFKKNKLHIVSDVYLKSEIKINKERILKEIKKQNISREIIDII